MRRSSLLLAASLVVAGATFFSSANEAEDRLCTSATSGDVRQLYTRLAAALAARDVEAVTALYSPDAILMGPGAATIRLGHAEIALYYSALLHRRPEMTVLDRVVETACGSLSDRGTETVAWQSRGAPIARTARYALSYGRFGDRWLIVHHHQELLDHGPDAEVPVAERAPARIVTGTNPEPSVVIPPVRYALPVSAPVIVPRQRPLLPPSATETPIDATAIERLIAAVVQARPVPAPAIVLPPAPFNLLPGAPSIIAPRAATAAAARPDVAVLVLPALTLPATPFALPSGPPTIPDPTVLSVQPVVAAEVNPAPAQPAVAFAAKPAVAGFTQRADPKPAVPKAVPPSAALPKAIRPDPLAKAAAAAKATARAPAKEWPSKTGKFLGWDESRPLFDD